MFINYSSLSINAQRIFVHIERRMWVEEKEEIYITKEDLAWECTVSVPGVKVALRELKNAGYIVPRNKNSCWLKIGEEYAYREDRL